MITQQTIDNIKADIDLIVNGASPIVGVLAPEMVPALVIGKAVAKEFPQLLLIVEKWLAGQDPTDAELAAVRAQQAVLADPNLP